MTTEMATGASENTTAMIGLMNKDGSVKAVWLQFGGSIMQAGRTLLKSYDRKATEELLSFGDLAILGSNLGSKNKIFNNSFSTEKDTCIFYGRDRGEKNTESCVYLSIDDMKENRECDYFYIMKVDKGEDKWYITDLRESEEMFDLEKIIKNMH